MTGILGAARARLNPATEPGGSYLIPTEPPWNAPQYLSFPTPDGSSKVVHPSVHDFGSGYRWHGFRFWMAITPYPDSDAQQENPCILASHNGIEWVVPDGLTNPVYGAPPYNRFNSDPDLTYDPDTDELVLIYREQLQDASHQTLYARSPDGITWPAKATALNWTRPGQVLSPSIIRRGSGDWVLFGILRDQWTLLRYEATSLEGVWAGPYTCTGAPSNPWHLDVYWDGSTFFALVDEFGTTTDGLVCGTSSDGHAWSFDPDPVILPREGEWDAELYRPTFVPHEAGDRFRVWYSALGPDSWRTGYTEIPDTSWS